MVFNVLPVLHSMICFYIAKPNNEVSLRLQCLKYIFNLFISMTKMRFYWFQMKAVAGMKMSYQVQQAINTCLKDPVRGFRQDESSSALCAHLYSMIRGNRQHRRAFLISLLNLFDDTAVRTKTYKFYS